MNEDERAEFIMADDISGPTYSFTLEDLDRWMQYVEQQTARPAVIITSPRVYRAYDWMLRRIDIFKNTDWDMILFPRTTRIRRAVRRWRQHRRTDREMRKEAARGSTR